MTTLKKYAAAAEVLFPIRGQWSYEAWEQINGRYWDHSLKPGAILWGLTAGCNFGSFNPNNGAITLHEALPGRDFARRGEIDWVMANRDQNLNSWGLPASAFGIGTALGTLLHESMHQAHHQRGQHYPLNRKGGVEAHHNPIWVGECERVAEMIGLRRRIWPIYIERKERANEVRERMGPGAADLTGPQINNRRQWIWVPTIDGEEITPEEGLNGERFYKGTLLAEAADITNFPRRSFEDEGVNVADRVEKILPGH